ncbi:MAG: alpha/beta hydrolase [Parachlamydiaceae bacterium]|nr:alpha/beta hydrolase [Parachlamydiaceae bacterium]
MHPHPDVKYILSPQGVPIYFQGPDITSGPLPAVFYFALSGIATLYEDPFNQIINELSKEKIRIFSWDLPFHQEGSDPKQAMQQWSLELMQNQNFISDFTDQCKSHLDFLIDQKIVNENKIALAGLSRGGFIATHWCANDKRIKSLLGLAPLTKPQPLDDFPQAHIHSYKQIQLVHLVQNLLHANVRFYIGNCDKRVGTEACFEFINALSNTAYENGIKSPHVEMIIFPSIGHQGHGTPPHIFHAGAHWLTSQLL